MWQCPKCKVNIDGAFDTCWQCGTSNDGKADPSFQPEMLDDASWANVDSGSKKEAKDHLTCQRCNRTLTFVGTKKFHEGTRWGALGDLGELFVNK